MGWAAVAARSASQSNLPDAGSPTALVANGGGTIRTERGERVTMRTLCAEDSAPPSKRGNRDLFIVARTDALAERFGASSRPGSPLEAPAC